MFQYRKMHSVWFVVVGFLTLLFFSARQYGSIMFGNCYFQTNLLSCASEVMSLRDRIGILSVLCIVFILFILGGFKLWKYSDKKISDRGELLVGIILIMSAILIVPFGSNDVVYYFNAGKAVVVGINPFTELWANHNFFIYPVAGGAPDQLFSYGPIMTHIFACIYKLSQDSVVTFIVLWKIFLASMILLSAKLLKKLAPENHDLVSYIWIMQPLILFEILTSGHFDVIWITTILLAIGAASKQKWWLVFPLITIGIWAKFIPIFLVPWFVLWWWQGVTKQNAKTECVKFVFGAALSVLVTIISWTSFWGGMQVFKTIAGLSKWAVDSMFAAVYYSLYPLFAWGGVSNPHWLLTRVVHGLLCAVALYFLWPLIKDVYKIVTKKMQWHNMDYVKAIFISLSIYLFVWQKAFWPWYVIWLLPFGILILKNHFVKKIVLWISVAPLMFYPVWFIARMLFHVEATTRLWFCWFVVLSIMAYPLWQLFQWRKSGYALEFEIEKKEN